MIDTNLNSQAEHIEKYQSKLKQLLQQRQDIFKDIRLIRKRQRYFNGNSNQQHLDTPRKIIKKQNALQKHQETPTINNTVPNILKNNKEDIKKANQAQQLMKDRNKRMFGGLSQYLVKAKCRIQQEESKLKQKIEMEEKILEKEKKQNEAMKEEKKKLLENEKQSNNIKKQDNAKTLSSKPSTKTMSISSMDLYLQNHSLKLLGSQLRNLIQRKKSQQIVKKKKKLSSQKLRNQFVLTRKNLIQEYFRNKLNKYYEYKMQNIVTISNPPIFWKPVTSNEKIKQIFQKSKLSLLQEKQKIISQFEASFIKVISEQMHEDHSESQHSNKQQDSK